MLDGTTINGIIQLISLSINTIDSTHKFKEDVLLMKSLLWELRPFKTKTQLILVLLKQS